MWGRNEMITKEEAKEKVKELVEQFSSIPKSNLDSMPEEDIKFKFIEPLFEILGWERKDINKEPRVLQGRADYIFRLANQEKLVVDYEQDTIKKVKEFIKDVISLDGKNKVEVLKEVRNEFNMELKEASDLTNSALFELRVEKAASLLSEIDRVSAIKQLRSEWNFFTKDKTIELREVANIVDEAIARKK